MDLSVEDSLKIAGQYKAPETVRERIVEIVSRHCGEWGAADTLEEAGIDSLDFVEIVIVCERTFGFDWDDEIWPVTVNGFVDMLEVLAAVGRVPAAV